MESESLKYNKTIIDKYTEKISKYTMDNIFTNETKKYINNMINEHKYLCNVITENNVNHICDMNCENCIIINIGDSNVKLINYNDTFIGKDNIVELMLINEIYNMDNIEQLDLISEKYNDMIYNQIIIGYMYMNTDIVKKLDLQPVNNLNYFTRTIIYMVEMANKN